MILLWMSVAHSGAAEATSVAASLDLRQSAVLPRVKSQRQACPDGCIGSIPCCYPQYLRGTLDFVILLITQSPLAPRLQHKKHAFPSAMQKLTKVKATDKLSIPLKLDMASILAMAGAQPLQTGTCQDAQYELMSILIHKGPSASHGHYGIACAPSSIVLFRLQLAIPGSLFLA